MRQLHWHISRSEMALKRSARAPVSAVLAESAWAAASTQKDATMNTVILNEMKDLFLMQSRPFGFASE